MEVHICCSVNAKSQADNICVRYNDNTIRPKSKENQLGILKIYAFFQKIQQRASGSRESAAGVTYLCMRIHAKVAATFPKSCHNFT